MYEDFRKTWFSVLMGQEIPHPQPLYLQKKMFMQIIKGFIAYRIKAESAAFQRNHYQQLSVCVLCINIKRKHFLFKQIGSQCTFCSDSCLDKPVWCYTMSPCFMYHNLPFLCWYVLGCYQFPCYYKHFIGETFLYKCGYF